MPGGLSIGKRTTPATRIKRMTKRPGYPRGVLPRKGYRRGSYHRGGIEGFQINNEERRGLNIAPPETMTIPCVAMADTRSTFYLVDVHATTAFAQRCHCWTVSDHSTPGQAMSNRSNRRRRDRDGGYRLKMACSETLPRHQDPYEMPPGTYFLEEGVQMSFSKPFWKG